MPLAVLLSFRFLIDLHGTKNAMEDQDELEALAGRVDALPTATDIPDKTTSPMKEGVLTEFVRVFRVNSGHNSVREHSVPSVSSTSYAMRD